MSNIAKVMWNICALVELIAASIYCLQENVCGTMVSCTLLIVCFIAIFNKNDKKTSS